MKHFISIADTTLDELQHVFDVAIRLREQRASGRGHEPVLAGRSLAMTFEKPYVGELHRWSRTGPMVVNHSVFPPKSGRRFPPLGSIRLIRLFDFNLDCQ